MNMSSWHVFIMSFFEAKLMANTANKNVLLNYPYKVLLVESLHSEYITYHKSVGFRCRSFSLHDSHMRKALQSENLVLVVAH